MLTLKQLATLLATTAALLTSITSLVKALDKTVEQTSYETLSKKIIELQDENQAIKKEMGLVEEGLAHPAPSSSSSASPSSSSSSPTLHPSAPAPHAPPIRSAFRPPPAPPPPWGDVRERASKK